MLRLAVLLHRDPAVAAVVAERLRLSNENRDRLIDLSGAQEAIAPGMPVTELRKLLYRLGAQRVRDRIFLRWSEDTDISHDLSWNELLNVADNWRIPEFPLSGRDVLAAGIPAGPRVGAILSQIEMDWIEGDFGDDRASLLKRLDAISHTPSH
jgi:poly(A) polymerase